MKNNKISQLFYFALCIVCMLTGCSVQLTTLEIENAWTNTLDENNIDYKMFSEPAKQVIYSLRSNDIDGFFSPYSDDIAMLKKLISYTDASDMESDAIVNAAVEDAFIIAGITEAYANAESINYAVKTYCERCYENQKVVKPGKHAIRLSSKVTSGKVKYNGKISDLKKFLNNYIHPESRNGYCVIEINDYNTPVSVKWSKMKIEDTEESYTSSFDIAEVEMGADIVGNYPNKFYVTNTITDRTISKSSLSSELGDYQAASISSDDIKDMQDWLVETFNYEIDNAINLAELGDDDANIEIINDIGDDTSTENYSEYELESMMSTANSNAKQVYTAFNAALTQMSIQGIKPNTYEFCNGSDSDLEAIINGYDLDLTSYLGDEFKGYYYVYFNPDTYNVYYALWSEKTIPDDMKKTLTTNEQNQLLKNGVAIGCFPIDCDISELPNVKAD